MNAKIDFVGLAFILVALAIVLFLADRTNAQYYMGNACGYGRSWHCFAPDGGGCFCADDFMFIDAGCK